MIIPKKNRIAIYEALFRDGCIVAIKDGNKKSHDELTSIRNLEVMKAMQVRCIYNGTLYFDFMQKETCSGLG